MDPEDEQLEQDLAWLHQAQAEIMAETEGLTPEEEVAYYREQARKARETLDTPPEDTLDHPQP